VIGVAEEERRTGGLAINTIHTMDCIEGMQRLPAGSVDIIVTSPPYNIGKEYNTYDDQKPREDYLRWMGQVAAGASRVSRRRTWGITKTSSAISPSATTSR